MSKKWIEFLIRWYENVVVISVAIIMMLLGIYLTVLSCNSGLVGMC